MHSVRGHHPRARRFSAALALLLALCLAAASSPASAGVPAIGPSLSFTAIDAGDQHNCGIRTDDTLACWGDPYGEQLKPPPGRFRAVSAGAGHSCGIRSDSTVICWGADYDGQARPPAGTFTAISAGYDQTCGIRTDGSVTCWGSDYYGQSSAPAGSFTAISAGELYACGVQGDGAIACWGGEVQGRATPPPGSFRSVTTGRTHACAITTEATIACWGDDAHGKATPPAGAFTAVTAARDHTCGVLTDGSAVCWGADVGGQCIGSDCGTTTPPSGEFDAVTTGLEFTCALSSTGQATCWGWNDYRQLAVPRFLYVAFGDGVASGEAVPPFTATSSTDAPCHRSEHSYARQLAARQSLQVQNVACRGAIVENVEARGGEVGPTQARQADLAEADVVSITIGAGDIRTYLQTRREAEILSGSDGGGSTFGRPDTDWRSVMMRCHRADDCRQRFPNLSADIARLRPALTKMYVGLTSTYDSGYRTPSSGRTHIAVVGYPHIFANPDRAGYRSCGNLSAKEARWLRNRFEDLSRTVGRAVTAAREQMPARFSISYVPTLNALRGHERCSRAGEADRWVHGIVKDRPAFSFYPKLKGQSALSRVLENHLESRGVL